MSQTAYCQAYSSCKSPQSRLLLARSAATEMHQEVSRTYPVVSNVQISAAEILSEAFSFLFAINVPKLELTRIEQRAV